MNKQIPKCRMTFNLLLFCRIIVWIFLNQNVRRVYGMDHRQLLKKMMMVNVYGELFGKSILPIWHHWIGKLNR